MWLLCPASVLQMLYSCVCVCAATTLTSGLDDGCHDTASRENCFNYVIRVWSLKYCVCVCGWTGDLSDDLSDDLCWLAGICSASYRRADGAGGVQVKQRGTLLSRPSSNCPNQAEPIMLEQILLLRSTKHVQRRILSSPLETRQLSLPVHRTNPQHRGYAQSSQDHPQTGTTHSLVLLPVSGSSGK